MRDALPGRAHLGSRQARSRLRWERYLEIRAGIPEQWPADLVVGRVQWDARPCRAEQASQGLSPVR